MAKSSIADRDHVGERTCRVCGVSSHEKTLVGLKNDRSKDGPRFCVPHNPDSFVGAGALGWSLLERVS